MIIQKILINRLIGLIFLYGLGGILFSSIGDSESYVKGLWKGDVIETLTFSTQFIHFLTYISGGPWVCQALFTFFSFFGLWYPLRNEQWVISNPLVLSALYIPSVLMWTTPVGKEAVTVLGLGLLLGCWFDYRRHRPVSALALIAGVYLVFLFKKQYLFPIISGLIVYKSPFARDKDVPIFGMFLIAFFLMLFCSVYWTELNYLFITFDKYFDPSANSTRASIWRNDGDFLLQMPLGIWLSFMGFTPFELIENNKLTNYFFFGESIILSLILATLMNPKRWIHKAKSYHSAIVILLFFLIVHYPFGALNAGSAARYRSGFIPFLVFFLYLEPILPTTNIKLLRHIRANR